MMEFRTRSPDDWLEAGKMYMDKHYANGITIYELASYLNVHRSYLSKKFTEHYQLSPKQYLHQLKMKRAAELLCKSSMSVTEIAHSLQYSDSFVFSRAYKNYHRCAPSYTRQQALAK